MGRPGWDYEESEILEALRWADMVALWSMAAFADLADDKLLASVILTRLRETACDNRRFD